MWPQYFIIMIAERIKFCLEIVLFLKVSNGEHQLIVGTFRYDWLAAGACRPYTLPRIQKGRAKRGSAALESATTDRWVYFFNNIQNKFRSSDKVTSSRKLLLPTSIWSGIASRGPLGLSAHKFFRTKFCENMETRTFWLEMNIINIFRSCFSI